MPNLVFQHPEQFIDVFQTQLLALIATIHEFRTFVIPHSMRDPYEIIVGIDSRFRGNDMQVFH